MCIRLKLQCKYLDTLEHRSNRGRSHAGRNHLHSHTSHHLHIARMAVEGTYHHWKGWSRTKMKNEIILLCWDTQVCVCVCFFFFFFFLKDESSICVRCYWGTYFHATYSRQAFFLLLSLILWVAQCSLILVHVAFAIEIVLHF